MVRKRRIPDKKFFVFEARNSVADNFPGLVRQHGLNGCSNFVQSAARRFRDGCEVFGNGLDLLRFSIFGFCTLRRSGLLHKAILPNGKMASVKAGCSGPRAKPGHATASRRVRRSCTSCLAHRFRCRHASSTNVRAFFPGTPAAGLATAAHLQRRRSGMWRTARRHQGWRGLLAPNTHRGDSAIAQIHPE